LLIAEGGGIAGGPDLFTIGGGGLNGGWPYIFTTWGGAVGVGFSVASAYFSCSAILMFFYASWREPAMTGLGG